MGYREDRMDREKNKIPVTERQFLWVQDDDKGEVVLHVGPTMVSPTAADRIVVSDGKGGFMEQRPARPQRMVELSDSEYAVLYNPLTKPQEDGGPNGAFRPGRNESMGLRNGTRHMIGGPCSFYLRPGQRVEVRDAHELSSNQYLVVKVYGEVDGKAPYYRLTAKSAGITTATAEDVAGSIDAEQGDELEEVELTRGQLIVIRGLDTQFYIPPTGVDIVPDLSIDDRGTKLTADLARKILQSTPVPPSEPADAAPESAAPAEVEMQQMLANDLNALAEEAEAGAFDDDEYDDRPAKKISKRNRRAPPVQQAARARHVVQRKPQPRPARADKGISLSRGEVDTLLSNQFYRKALEREVRKARLVRQAVVLGEKEFCVIMDADGKREIKVGPARVFPGPYDSFETEGADQRVYKAFELLPQRALWLRFISEVPRDKLRGRLPRGVELDQDAYYPGDELILTKVNSFFFPFNEIEILHPLTGQPHVGNDHSDVFIEAIGVDQKSGIYVRDLTTGEVRLVLGKQSYLVDPRKEVHITRAIPADDWNLWITPNELHKQTTVSVVTPWALSIVVPHNTAVLAASAAGQRVIEGPITALLEYDEKLVPMTLSTGRPKHDKKLLRTCFLRTVGNSVSDIIRVETADFVEVDIQVSYRVSFTPEHSELWFNHENYVGVLTDHLRSLVRARCRQITLTDFWSNVPAIIRDIILGPKTDDGRKGRLFEENGMQVTEVEVLTSNILDKEISDLLEKVQRGSVALLIADRQATEQLRSEKLRHSIEKDRIVMLREGRELRAALDALKIKLGHEASLSEVQNGEVLARTTVEGEVQREALRLKAQLERDDSAGTAAAAGTVRDAKANVEATQMLHTEEQSYRKALSDLEVNLVRVRSAATVSERQAIQPALVEALTALGDKIVLGEVANNMNLVSLFKGRDIASLFAEILGGSKLARTVATMLPADGNGAPAPASADD